MHTSNSTLTKVVAILLTFIMGFLTCLAALFGIGYYTYSRVSLDKLKEWGYISFDTTDTIAENPDVSLTALTMKQLVAEISYLLSLEDTLTLESFLNRYGLTLTQRIKDYLPDTMLKMDIRDLFTRDGYTYILDNTNGDYILTFAADGDFNNILREELAKKTLREVLSLNFDSLLGEMDLGVLMGYEPVYDETETKILAWKNDAGEEIEPILENVADIKISEFISGSLDTQTIFEGKYGGHLIGYTPHFKDASETEIDYWTKTVDKTDEKGNPIDENKDGIIDTEEIVVTGTDKGIANIALDRLMDKDDDYEVEDAFDGVYFGELMRYTRAVDEDGYYVDPDGNRIYKINENGNYVGSDGRLLSDAQVEDLLRDANFAWLDLNDLPIGALENKVANYSVAEVLRGNIEFSSTELTEGLVLADLLDYTSVDYYIAEYNEDADEYVLAEITEGTVVPEEASVITVWYDSDGNEVTGVLSAIADKEIEGLSETIDGLTISQVLGYYDIGKRDEQGDIVWFDYNTRSSGKNVERYMTEAGGLMLSFAHLTINEMSDEEKVSDAVQTIVVGDALGYTVDENGIWYSKEIDPETGEVKPVTGIMKNLVGLPVSEIHETVNEMTVADVLGYGYCEKGDHYHETEDLTSPPVDGIMARLATAKLNSLNDEVHKLYMGDIEGLTLCYKKEITFEGNKFEIWVPATPENPEIGFTKEELEKPEYTWCDAVDDEYGYPSFITVNDLYPNSGREDGDEVVVESIYGDNGELLAERQYVNYTPATGVTVKFADLKIDDMTDPDKLVEKIKTVTVAEALGLEEREDNPETADVDESGWYDKNNGEQASSIISALAEKPISDIGDEINKLTIKDMFPDNYDQGFLGLLDESTTLEELSGDGESSLSDTFKTKSIQEFMDAGLLDFGEINPNDDTGANPNITTAEKLNNIDAAKLLVPDPDDTDRHLVKLDANGIYHYDLDGNGEYNSGTDKLFGWRAQNISDLIAYILPDTTVTP